MVDAARAALSATRRGDIGDQRIGHLLRYAPVGEDGRWPPIAAVPYDVAGSYEAEARRWDDEAQLTEDTWR